MWEESEIKLVCDNKDETYDHELSFKVAEYTYLGSEIELEDDVRATILAGAVIIFVVFSVFGTYLIVAIFM